MASDVDYMRQQEAQLHSYQASHAEQEQIRAEAEEKRARERGTAAARQAEAAAQQAAAKDPPFLQFRRSVAVTAAHTLSALFTLVPGGSGIAGAFDRMAARTNQRMSDTTRRAVPYVERANTDADAAARVQGEVAEVQRKASFAKQNAEKARRRAQASLGLARSLRR